jgi:sialic acid synthase SpsE
MKKITSNKNSLYVLAEAAQSYEGNESVAIELTRNIKESGADGIMFQVVFADELSLPINNNYKAFKNLEIRDDFWKEVVSSFASDDFNIIGEIFGSRSLEVCEKAMFYGYKIHVADICNLPFLREVSFANKPVLLGVGGAENDEILEAIQALKSINDIEVKLMHGFQLCPTPINLSNLRKINALKNTFKLPVGYSDHSEGFIPGDFSKKSFWSDYLSLASSICDAELIEKHVMLSRDKKWEDHESAITPIELQDFIKKLNINSSSLGQNSTDLTSAELEYQLTSRKYIVSMKKITKGQLIQEDDLAFKRIENPKTGIRSLKSVISKRLNRDVDANEQITMEDLE